MAKKKTSKKKTRHRDADARNKSRATRQVDSRRGRRRLKPFAVAPTLLTLGNLISGFAAIYFAFMSIDYSGPFGWSGLSWAGICIFLGMLCDGLDGSVARWTRTHSDFGGQLDSLADMVSFGVAPAFMMLQLVSHYIGPEGAVTILGPLAETAFSKVVWGIAAVYVACTALRLARFNVETPSAAVEDHMVFRGLPSPGAAGAVASLIIMHQHYLAARSMDVSEVTQAFARWSAFGVPFITLLCAVAMVSSIPYIHFINRYIRGTRPFGYVAVLVILVMMLAVWLQEVLALTFTMFALSGPVRLGVRRFKRRRALTATEGS